MISYRFPNGAQVVFINDEWVPVFAGGVGFGVNSSESQSKQVTGLRGTDYEGRAASRASSEGNRLTNFTDQMFSSPDAMMNLGKQMLPGGKYGLGENSDRGVEALGDYQFGKASANSATRGQVNPENMSNVIGSSMQNMLPFLIPQLQAAQAAQFNAPQSLLQTAKTSSDYWLRALGSQGKSEGEGFGFNASVLSGGGNQSASDRSIKESIVRVGTHLSGIGIYCFQYMAQYRDQWGHGTRLGVMADEVLQVCPEAVSVHPGGYFLVDYGKLD